MQDLGVDRSEDDDSLNGPGTGSMYNVHTAFSMSISNCDYQDTRDYMDHETLSVSGFLASVDRALSFGRSWTKKAGL